VFTLTIMDLQGGGMDRNGVHKEYATAYDAFEALFSWIERTGKHLPIQYSGYKYSWFIKDPQGKEII